MIEVTSPPHVPGPPPHFHIGIPMQESQAQEKSVVDQIVQNVLKNVERYGMYLAA